MGWKFVSTEKPFIPQPTGQVYGIRSLEELEAFNEMCNNAVSEAYLGASPMINIRIDENGMELSQMIQERKIDQGSGYEYSESKKVILSLPLGEVMRFINDLASYKPTIKSLMDERDQREKEAKKQKRQLLETELEQLRRDTGD